LLLFGGGGDGGPLVNKEENGVTGVGPPKRERVLVRKIEVLKKLAKRELERLPGRGDVFLTVKGRGGGGGVAGCPVMEKLKAGERAGMRH